MAPRPRPELAEARCALAGVIDAALKAGQFHDPNALYFGQPWTNEAFASAVTATESAVRSWRDQRKPIRPVNIVPLLAVFHGDNPRFAEARQAMLNVWRRAGGYIEDVPPPPQPSGIETKKFSDAVAVVDLSVGQPLPDNAGNNLILPWTVNIYPDPRCVFEDKKIEIGVTAAFVLIESEHWQPHQESVFRKKNHPNIEKDATPGGVQLVGPTDGKGRIAGAPLEDEPSVKMEPKGKGASGSIDVSVRVFRDGFTVTPRDAADVSETQKFVLDAIFGSAFETDANQRLIVARETVWPLGKTKE